MKHNLKVLMVGMMVLLNLNTLSAQSEIDIVKRLTTLHWLSNLTPRTMAEDVMQDNEFEHNIFGVRTDIHANPLCINGKMLNYNQFMIGTKGILTVVKGKPESEEATPIAFYVYIRRKGVIVKDDKMTFGDKPLYKINLSKVFPFCKNGDMLIIKPARLENWKAKRILKLIEGC